MTPHSFRNLRRRERAITFNPWLSHFVTFLLGYGLSTWNATSKASADRPSSNKLAVSSHSLRSAASGCQISLGAYRGPEYRTSQTVGAPTCLVESKFLKVQQHAVQFGPDEKVIPDWLWIDYHERINVLVQAPDSVDEFLVFAQSKYALEEKTSLAIVGGIIEPTEEASQAARREVAEEMKLECDDFHFLGRYRTDVNRGVGWTNSYLATRCHHKAAAAHEAQHPADEVGVADTERQDLQHIKLHDLREAVVAGKFMEIQWSATIALALLHPELFDTTKMERR
jgi:8-oxo-dGTP pyrophosphatase MutT (NUDIX family)